MTKEHLPFIVIMTVAFCFGCASIVAFNREKNQDALVQAAELNRMRLGVPSAVIIGSSSDIEGDIRAPYTLVEFGDYQCPPCRAANSTLKSILQKNKYRLNFVFRNLPLKNLHVYAEPAAVAAEAARDQGKFWQFHDQLYKSSIDFETIDKIASREHLNMPRFERARKSSGPVQVAKDIAIAHSIGLDSTPSFILCCPGGKVLHLNSIDEIVLNIH